MSTFGTRVRPHVEFEFEAAASAEAAGQARLAFARLERAHVLGQASTVEHVRVHWRMLLWGVRHRHARECFGQIVRLVGAATKTVFGLVPHGNTGGSNAGPFERMPVSPELAARIEEARASSG